MDNFVTLNIYIYMYIYQVTTERLEKKLHFILPENFGTSVS